MSLSIRPAVLADLPVIHPVIERAYRGETARQGWTHEADLIEGPRTDLATLTAIVEDPAQMLLIALEDKTPIGCVNVADRGGDTAYLGLLCIDPARQAGGLGRELIAAAEAHARQSFGCTRIEMTVIEARRALIDYYLRRGYAETGERRDFPIPLDPPLFMTVLAKRLV
ncbi:GNAT family N-acetyltransferase [Sphingomonas sp. TDK1]|uniref:GNAT family N-acetyltransferase n=1 Tax=Sphingomonas sp. TDK1 TaxID=453247 RepID=UPI0007D8E956|nr:GNAT family N-acetyltransferase [Sphingomonas sp. TDK1]OAN59853.1 GCN5 family acetyltransferase [Sphingomonas sp. TDK1]